MKIFLFFAIFLPCIAQLSDNNLRNFWMPLAAAAYSDNPIQCLEKTGWGFEVYRQYTFDCDLINDTCSAYLAINNCTNNTNCIIVISFRGTSSVDQLVEEGWHYKEMVPFVSGGKVSKYFFNAFNGIWNDRGMKNDVYTLKNKYQTPDFYLQGHSLGGAMAAIATGTLVSTGITTSNKISLFTFGQPRTGNKDFANAINSLKIGYETFRVVHKYDIVPHLPPKDFSDYYHFGYEFWYPNYMLIGDEYSSCYNSDEYDECSNEVNFLEYDIDDHKYYFGREFSEYGINGCPDLVQPIKADSESVRKWKKPYTYKTMKNENL